MTTKIKTTLLTVFFLFALLTGLQAQDKYEYANITYYTGGNKLAVSLNGTAFSEEKVEITREENSILNSNPLFKKVNEYQNKGWEVLYINTFSVGVYVAYYAILRKKQ